MSKNTPRDLTIPAELEEYIREHAQEILTRAVESAAKRGFAVEYKAVSTLKAPDCYDCGLPSMQTDLLNGITAPGADLGRFQYDGAKTGYSE